MATSTPAQPVNRLNPRNVPCPQCKRAQQVNVEASTGEHRCLRCGVSWHPKRLNPRAVPCPNCKVHESVKRFSFKGDPTAFQEQYRCWGCGCSFPPNFSHPQWQPYAPAPKSEQPAVVVQVAPPVAVKTAAKPRGLGIFGGRLGYKVAR